MCFMLASRRPKCWQLQSQCNRIHIQGSTRIILFSQARIYDCLFVNKVHRGIYIFLCLNIFQTKVFILFGIYIYLYSHLRWSTKVFILKNFHLYHHLRCTFHLYLHLDCENLYKDIRQLFGQQPTYIANRLKMTFIKSP